MPVNAAEISLFCGYSLDNDCGGGNVLMLG
jgi:hypothetical protein